jgi:hypothetical protein
VKTTATITRNGGTARVKFTPATKDLRLTTIQAEELAAILRDEAASLVDQIADEGDVEFKARLRESKAIVAAILRQLEGGR